MKIIALECKGMIEILACGSGSHPHILAFGEMIDEMAPDEARSAGYENYSLTSMKEALVTDGNNILAQCPMPPHWISPEKPLISAILAI
jgi:hypothetical protein